MESPQLLLQNLALILVVAAATTLIFRKLKQPVVLGYLLAGMIVGPYVPIPLVADTGMVSSLSELGVILLLFSVGLEFSVRKMIGLAPTAGFIALLQCSLMMWLGYLTGRIFGWTVQESLYAGAIIAISSTTIIAKVFQERGISGKLSDIVFSILIVEDLIGILLLALLTTLTAGRGGVSTHKFFEVTGSLTVFVVVIMMVGLLIVPRIIRGIIRMGQDEMTLIVSIGICFGLAFVAHAFGYSVALGAFVAGALIAESGEGRKVEHLIKPVRDIFAAIFFVSVGMLIDPSVIIKHWEAVLVFSIVVIVGKFIGVFIGTFLTGQTIRTSVQSGMSLAQIGEFSFIIAAAGVATGATRSFIYPLAVGVSAVTTLVTPWLIRSSAPIARRLDKSLPASIQTFASLYGSWIRQLNTSSKKTGVRSSPIRRLIGLLIADLLILTALIAAASYYFDKINEILLSLIPIPSGFFSIVIIGATFVLAMPFCIGLIRCARSLGLALALQVLPLKEKGQLDLAAVPRRALVVTLQLTVILVTGLFLLAFTQPFLPLFYSSLVFGICLVILVFIFWRRTEELQAHVKAGAQVMIEALLPKDKAEDDFSRQIRDMLPGLGDVTAVRLKPESPSVGKSLVGLDLRGLTGVTVMAIVREGKEFLAPSGREPLQAGDVLALTGSDEAIEAAKQILL